MERIFIYYFYPYLFTYFWSEPELSTIFPKIVEQKLRARGSVWKYSSQVVNQGSGAAENPALYGWGGSPMRTWHGLAGSSDNIGISLSSGSSHS